MDDKCCENCKYMRKTEEYWHDHYLIQSHTVCIYGSRSTIYSDSPDVDPKACCSHHEYGEWYKNKDGE